MGFPRCAQDARIYVSDHLPDWIKAIRNTGIAYTQLTYSYVGTLTSLDRVTAIQTGFKIEDKEESSIVKISFSGVNEENALKTNPSHEKQYRKLSPKMQVFITDHRYHVDSEKSLFNISMKKEKLPMENDEFRENARLFIKTNLQHIETLDYFTRHPEKLKEFDYQTLLTLILFKESLEKNLAIPGFETKLRHFVQNNYEQFIQENEIQAAVFFLKLAHQLYSFCPNQDFFKSATTKLKALLERKGLEHDLKCLLYAELIAQLGHQQSITEEEAALIVAGSIYIEENQPQSKIPEDPSAAKEARETLVVHANKIKTILQKGNPNNKVLNQILKLLRTDSIVDNEWIMKEKSGEFPHFVTKDGKEALYPLLSKLLSYNAVAVLPLKLRENALFKKLFPEVQQGLFLQGDVFSFKDRERDTLVHLKGDCLIIDQKLDPQKEEWFRYIPTPSFITEQFDKYGQNKKLNSIVGSRHLIHHFSHWQSLTENSDQTVKIYAVDLNTGKPQYEFRGRSPSAEEMKKTNEIIEPKITEIKKEIEKDYVYLSPENKENKFKEKLDELNSKSFIYYNSAIHI